jgi:hypothetical protein
MTIKAVYQDQAGNRYSCPVVRNTENLWKLSTGHGLRDLDYYMAGSDAVGGLIEFVDYEIYPQQNLRPADYIPFINRVRATLPWPQKPAEPPKLQTKPEDTRIHIEPRQPGQSSFTQLKEAANRAGEVARAARDRERREMLEKANQRDPRKVQQARHVNNLIAGQRRPKRSTGE